MYPIFDRFLKFDKLGGLNYGKPRLTTGMVVKQLSTIFLYRTHFKIWKLAYKILKDINLVANNVQSESQKV